MKKSQFLMKSKIGPLYLVASEKGLCGLLWDKQKVPLVTSLKRQDKEVRWLSQTVHELEEYFLGRRKSFTVPLDVEGTPFQRSVWGALSQIPHGETCSYKDIAEKINNPGAVRAVGTANGRNPVSIIVPCHRVIAADGSLGGYGGGLAIKTQLLDLEKRANQT